MQTCKPGDRSQSRRPHYGQTARAIELIFGGGLVRPQIRLTGFGGARNIICVRTKMVKAAKVDSPASPELRYEVWIQTWRP
jgi:hypothetical protein